MEFHIQLKPLESDLNVTLADNSTINPTYSERILSSLVLRFAPRQDVIDVQAVTISPKDAVLNNYSCKELDREIIKLTNEFLGIHCIFYPEIGTNNRYHYHGLVWYPKNQSVDFTIYLKYLNKRFGNTYVQRVHGITTEYKAYNAKKKCDQTTSFQRVVEYITKSVNNEKLLQYLNKDQEMSNKLEKNKSFKKMKITTVITTLHKSILNWLKEGYKENENNIEIF